MDIDIGKTLNYTAYQYDRREKPAASLTEKYPRAEQFERMYQQDFAGAGAGDCLPGAA